MIYPLVICHIAIENCPVDIVDFPINSMVIFQFYVNLPEGKFKTFQLKHLGTMIPPTTRWHEVMVNCAQGRSRSATFTIATPIFQGWGDSPRLGRKQRRPVVDGQTMYHSLIIVKKHLNQTKRALWYLVIQWKALVASHLDSNRALSKLKRGLQETMFFFLHMVYYGLLYVPLG